MSCGGLAHTLRSPPSDGTWATYRVPPVGLLSATCDELPISIPNTGSTSYRCHPSFTADGSSPELLLQRLAFRSAAAPCLDGNSGSSISGLVKTGPDAYSLQYELIPFPLVLLLLLLVTPFLPSSCTMNETTAGNGTGNLNGLLLAIRGSLAQPLSLLLQVQAGPTLSLTRPLIGTAKLVVAADPCASDSCENNGTCVAGGYTATCSCPDCYSGPVCQHR